MNIRKIPVPGYERVAIAHDRASGLKAMIAVHDRTLGPALGGMRMWKYNNDDEALNDVLRLARGMTYKSAVARTGLGGGKAVIVGDPKTQKTPGLFLAMGGFIDSFAGAYITAEDVGTTIADLKLVKQSTPHVTGLAREDGGSGNPSPYTARGCFVGLRAAAQHAFGSPNLAGRKIAIQGCGAVGSAFAKLLAEAGAIITVSDLYIERAEALVKSIGARAVEHDAILYESCDILAPSALGGVINDKTIARLNCKVVAGCANNQLLEPRHGDMLHERGILYAPDYVINAGGIINVGCELLPGGYDEAEALRRIDTIYDSLKQVFELSQGEEIPPHRAADRVAEQILESARVAKN